MRVFVAGATGVIGRQLVPILSSVGHDVIGLVRPSASADEVERAGAQVAIADALDPAALCRAVKHASPDAVVNLLTAIPDEIRPRRFARDIAMTNRLRTEATRNLLEAGTAAGCGRFIAEGLAYAYDPQGQGLANEDTPLWNDPPKQFAPAVEALIELETLTREANGLVLRLGHLYGPGSSYAANGSFTRDVRARKVPLVGAATSVFSFIHARDAATAIVAALDKATIGVLNVVDDEPTAIKLWLPALANILGAGPPKHVPTAVARMVVGGWGTAFMTRLRGADNARTRLALDWRPQYRSWREGFADLSPAGATTAAAAFARNNST